MVKTATLQSAKEAPKSFLVRAYQNADAQAWDDFVQNAATATFCHLSGWARVIQRVWQHEPQHLLAETNGKISGILPLFHVKSRLFGSMLVSTPNAVYGGIVADGPEEGKALITKATTTYTATVTVDGLTGGEVQRFKQRLRQWQINVHKVRGARDESSPLIRLADAFAGFIRDYIEGQQYAKDLYDRAVRARIVREV